MWVESYLVWSMLVQRLLIATKYVRTKYVRTKYVNHSPNRACSSSRWCGLITRTPHKLATPTYTPEPLSLPYHEVLAHFASSKAIKSRKPYRMSLRAQVAGLSIRTACKQKKQRRNAACKAKERKSAYNPKNFIVADLMYDRNRIRPPCSSL